MTAAQCKDCGWEGDEDVLERLKCPQCGSRRIVTEAQRLSNADQLQPPPDALDGD